MFTDERVDAASLRSAWRKSEAVLETRGSQTAALRRAEAEVQTVSTAAASCQTEPEDGSAQQLLPPPQTPGLEDFLRRAEATVTRELLKNARSHAFDRFQPSWEDHSQQVSLLHCLQHAAAQEKGLHVTSLSWSCTGSLIACAYGRIDDGDWSTEPACVCTWNLDLRGLRSQQADLVVEVPTAVTALCCHPSQPALIAGGLYSGEVLVWDTSRTQDPVLAQTGMSAEGHREPVYQVAWVDLQKKGEFGVLSAGSGGRVLLRTLDPDRGLLVLHAAYAFLRQQVPHSSSSSSVKVRAEDGTAANTDGCPSPALPSACGSGPGSGSVSSRPAAAARWGSRPWRCPRGTRTPSWWGPRGACCCAAPSRPGRRPPAPLPRRAPCRSGRRRSSPSGPTADPSTPSTALRSTGTCLWPPAPTARCACTPCCRPGRCCPSGCPSPTSSRCSGPRADPWCSPPPPDKVRCTCSTWVAGLRGRRPRWSGAAPARRPPACPSTAGARRCWPWGRRTAR
ncbi:cytoplasmic dynein 2 intermediate chain 2 isoform X1 [Salarias fasciatus]|uniref:cytoplasmic dynein 2 intermediate chain 2 isoform X1 n=1 Tax=Salarias fasciatus TaxID=181472 RepID=UPI001176AA2D|nr:WD repeat-containing protein 34 isoform X1 [Salarias fasciatus]